MSPQPMLLAHQCDPSKDLTILIPARAGSKRVENKNTRLLGGKPLISWTIESAKAADAREIIVSTDNADLALALVLQSNVSVHKRRPEHATDDSPDIRWVLDVLPMVQTPIVAICRPTSPFRTASTIRRAYALLKGSPGAHSVRAVRKVTEHPGKMWHFSEGDKFMWPILPANREDGTPWHSSPTQTLPAFYIQTASMEVAYVDAIRSTKTISGCKVVPFLVDDLEALDINTESDFARAEQIAATVLARR